MRLEPSLARRIRGEREARAWSLGGLAERAGVSKAMLSKIERAEASPTAATLSRIATAYGLTLAALFERATEGSRLVRAKDQPIWRDPKTSYLRRQVFLSQSNPLELVEVELPPRQEVGFPASAYHLIHQVVWVLKTASPLWRARGATNLPRATAWSSMRRRTWFSAMRAKSPAAMSSPSCGDDERTRLIRNFAAEALPFPELSAHICAKPTERRRPQPVEECQRGPADTQ